MAKDAEIKIFSKSGKRLKDEEKKMKEMNEVFKNTMYSEEYRGPVKRTMMRGINDVIRAFRGDDEARAMRHARKAANIMRKRK